MGKGAIVTDAIAIVGLIAIGGLMFAQVPGLIDEIKDTLSKESVIAQSFEIANLITLVNIAPKDMSIEITHKLPSEVPYTVTVKDSYVTVEASNHKAITKTLSTHTFGPDAVKSLSITKKEIKKVE